MKKEYLIVTDTHEDEENVNYMIYKYNPDIILDCGDHTENKSFYTDKKIPWYFIPGNHENQEMIEQLMYNTKYIENLHLIKPGDLVSINGVNITGFGGNYSNKTYNNIGKRKKNSFFHITKEDVKKVEEMNNKRKLVDILLMHESSKELWEGTKYNFGTKINSQIIKKFPNVKFVISGHYHVPQDKLFYNEEKKHYRHEISLNTPEEYNYIFMEGENRNLVIKHMQNEPNYNTLL